MRKYVKSHDEAQRKQDFLHIIMWSGANIEYTQYNTMLQ